MNIKNFAFVGGTLHRLVPPKRVNICIYTRKLYNKANLNMNIQRLDIFADMTVKN